MFPLSKIERNSENLQRDCVSAISSLHIKVSIMLTWMIASFYFVFISIILANVIEFGDSRISRNSFEKTDAYITKLNDSGKSHTCNEKCQSQYQRWIQLRDSDEWISAYDAFSRAYGQTSQFTYMQTPWQRERAMAAKYEVKKLLNKHIFQKDTAPENRYLFIETNSFALLLPGLIIAMFAPIVVYQTKPFEGFQGATAFSFFKYEAFAIAFFSFLSFLAWVGFICILAAFYFMAQDFMTR